MDNSLENALYVVATPIGNLEDITLRALRILKNVDIIACEDTRNTSILLNKYEINTKLISYHKFSETEKSDFLLNYLKEGKSIALVSDAGTPLISDPGNILVQEVIKNNFKVISIPGASAIITLLSSTYRKDEDFKFIGFISRIKNQIIETISKNNNENLIFYESANRLLETLLIIQNEFPEKIVTIGRELTKKFEEIKTDNIQKIIEYYKTNTLKGEIVVFLHKSEIKELNLEYEIKKLKKLNFKDKEIANILSSLFEVNKNAVYKSAIEIKN